MTDRTATPRQRRQVQRDRAAGLTRVTVKVPTADADLIRRLAQRRRDRAQIAQPFPALSSLSADPEPTA